uniref:Uncharacterized protein n=1 Tax=Oryza meridionalis TaxID=40149 RepID=A0A0E0CA19_9ORYZ
MGRCAREDTDTPLATETSVYPLLLSGGGLVVDADLKKRSGLGEPRNHNEGNRTWLWDASLDVRG